MGRMMPFFRVQNWLFDRNCCTIIKIPKNLKDYEEDGILIDMRMHLLLLLFEVFFEAVPFAAIIVLNDFVLMDKVTVIAWISLIISAVVISKNMCMFFDDVCLPNKQNRKL